MEDCLRLPLPGASGDTRAPPGPPKTESLKNPMLTPLRAGGGWTRREASRQAHTKQSAPPILPLAEGTQKVLEIPKNLFQKVLWWGLGQSPIRRRHALLAHQARDS